MRSPDVAFPAGQRDKVRDILIFKIPEAAFNNFFLENHPWNLYQNLVKSSLGIISEKFLSADFREKLSPTPCGTMNIFCPANHYFWKNKLQRGVDVLVELVMWRGSSTDGCVKKCITNFLSIELLGGHRLRDRSLISVPQAIICPAVFNQEYLENESWKLYFFLH